MRNAPAPPVFPATALAALAAAWLLGFLPAASLAHTDARFYRGDIRASTSWEGVIRLTGPVVIRDGVTVTVDPGTQVLVQPGRENGILVRGRLLVRGTADRPVVFDVAGGCAKGAWGGILFEGGGTGIIEHARIRCSVSGLRGEPGRVTRVGVAVEAAP